MSFAAPRLGRNVTLEPSIADGSAIKLIGLGGVGSIVARYLTVFLRSLGKDVRLVLVDGDSFESGNSGRMFFSRYGNKAAVLREDLLAFVQHSRMSLVAIPKFVTPDNAGTLIQEGDIVVLAVDNHATRKLVSEHCSTLSDVCLVSGGNDGVESHDQRKSRGTYGNCQAYVREGGRDLTPPLTHLHPEIAEPSDRAPADADCTELAASVPQILFANLMVASSILNTLWLHLCGQLHYGEVCFDIADGLMRPLPLTEVPAPAAKAAASAD